MLQRAAASLQIDAIHSRAICDEIGYRLGEMLRRQPGGELPQRLRVLLEKLANTEEHISPSIAPLLGDMIVEFSGDRPTARQDAVARAEAITSR
jgi:hypothetical protein